MTTMTKWFVEVGDRREEISADLLEMLGFERPVIYVGDKGEELTRAARSQKPTFGGPTPAQKLAEAYATGLSGDEAALYAIRIQAERRAAQDLETARQKVAEIEARAAADRRAAEAIALRNLRIQKGLE